MKTKITKKLNIVLLFAISALLIPLNYVRGDDLTPPPYRGGPLSVYAHWNLLPGSTILNLTNWNSVDDSDPTTYLYSNFTPNMQIIPNNGIYDFQIPNWVDNMPVKYLRLQLTWAGTTQSPLNIFSQGLDGVNPVVGAITFASTPLILTSGVYQYFDIEYHPNLDFERIHVTMPATNYLTQTVVDTISTVPEPATMGLLGLGGLLLGRKKLV
jgi:hypothetical protein